MPTDQIAKVFQMDASEVVKILERAERSTSKDGSRHGKRVDEMMRLRLDSGKITDMIMTIPDAQCMAYLPTFAIILGQM